jgi:hypothetical protein
METHQEGILSSLCSSEFKQSNTKPSILTCFDEKQNSIDARGVSQSIAVAKTGEDMDNLVVSSSFKTKEIELQELARKGLEGGVVSSSDIPCVDFKTLFPFWLINKSATEEPPLNKTETHEKFTHSSPNFASSKDDIKFSKDSRDSRPLTVKNSLVIKIFALAYFEKHYVERVYLLRIDIIWVLN